ncbi:16S rRNA (adenine(1518)-N(6)/adenine(1519)-N(6))-dimethyltransferase RsmA [Fibrobacter sp. UBA3718]|jgi:16S rRNA (adenine1518-N6/adenine1519-N6)-dimethyltransferase|uniref:16S rRNA (adenine(1518)-N(6)/adenine(1519)-N(6))- dimethyltransferase RsmA n=1 Tax=Fibrobacter sp. UBA3718 TaxID=1946531 RepID=UPI0025BCD20F|nr:16S rRNA (adenine(1518)-N(6)/adenine(1519)-N(6))-dimethyltransferase RsmA [Fibrobacter sp. UBA3718]
MDRARRRKFGQNFLDVPTAQMIAGDLPAEAGDYVLEIGPGHGALTEHLLERAVQLTAVEIDEQCVEFLEQKFRGRENFRIENIDFLKFDLQGFLDAHAKPWVTGNLPYNVSTAIIAGLMPKLHLTRGFMGMVQLEVAERICAMPCSSNYGSLSVLVSAFADTQILRKIGPEHFTPRPNVDSATMLLTPKECPLQAPEGYFDFVRAAFTQKRKTLANSFGRAYDKKKIQEAIELLDYPTTVRAEELSPSQFLEFYKVIVGK